MGNLYVYSQFEQEFGRLLSPMEKEIINDWKKTRSDDLIIQALKQSVYNGVTKSLRYIDKILQRWNQEESTNDAPTPQLDDSWLD